MTRTRFAPSPTGYLHIGGARTALYCWLYAKKTKGTFILRIEDTDLERSTQESVQAILDAMEWLELDYQEGPYYQTKRFDRYKAVANQLLSEGKAYRCYCTKERLDELRNEQLARKEKPRYDGKCRDLRDEVKAGTPFVIRFKNPTDGLVEFNDLVRGPIKISNEELDDLIIVRTDGSPTYNFTVVVDDWDMKITHVIRGDDHINNTPRQINILKALDAPLPLYGHVPMILGSDGKRLSKRHGAVSVMLYREEGFLKEALLNYLVRLGWSHGDQEIFSRDELIEYFDFAGLNNSPASFNQEKLLWLNHHYIKTCDPDYIAKELAWQLEKMNVNYSSGKELSEIVKIQAERCKTLKEMAERSRYFFEAVSIPEDLKNHFSESLKPALSEFCDELLKLSEWTKENIHGLLKSVAEKYDHKLGKIAQPIRIAITGGTVSPPIDSTILLLGKEQVVDRIKSAIE